MSFKRYYVSPCRMNDFECRHEDDEEVYVSKEVDLVYGIAKDRFAELDKKYQSTRSQLEVVVKALEHVANKSQLALDTPWFRLDEESCDKIRESFAKIKEVQQ